MSKQKRYNNVHETLTASPPLPKTWKTPVYHLDHYTFRKHTRTVTVQLVGIRGNEKRTETISFPLLPGVTDAELIRAAVWFSPNNWTVSFGMNFSQFQGNFSRPLDERLLNALMSPRQSQSAQAHSQPQPPNDQPTLSNASLFQQQFQSPIPQPGQFQPPLSNTPQPSMSTRGNRRGVWQWYKTRTRKMKVSLGCATLIAVVLFFSIVSAAIGSGNSAPPTATPTPAQQAVITGDTPTLIPTPTQPAPTPTLKPTPKPTARPTPTVIVRPTPTPIPPKPTPTPSCQAVNGNPWCYNFTPGNLIYNPPSNFCDYFPCIGNFWNGNGYVVECQDTMYSLSGGIQGACSYHGGVMRPLYSH